VDWQNQSAALKFSIASADHLSMTGVNDSYDVFLCIRDFLAQELNEDAEEIFRHTRLLQDLGLDGNRAMQLLNQFRATFGVDMTGFRFDRHFVPASAYNWTDFAGGLLYKMTGWNWTDPARELLSVTVRDLVYAVQHRRLSTVDIEANHAALKNKRSKAAPPVAAASLDPVSTHRG
jgi:aryl carrier-like protein